MGLDSRARYTRMVIEEAFLTLLQEKAMAKITVTELCLVADINRATFYKHYQDIPDLMEKIEARIFDNLTETLILVPNSDLNTFLSDILRNIQLNADRYIVLGSDNGDPGLAVKAFLTCYEKAYPLLVRNLPHMSPDKQRMMYHFLAQGCGGVLTHWIHEGMQTEPEEVVAFILEICKRVVK